MALKIPSQGQIVKLNLDPTEGHEQAGYRPVLIVSNNDFNKMCGGIVKVIPITTTHNGFPLHMTLPAGLPIYGDLELEHERSVDIVARGYRSFCTVPTDFLKEIILRLKLTI